MKKYLLPNTGKFYKANLHTHTVLSDGHLTKEQVKEAYQRHGYSVIAYTDHRHYANHQELNDDHFLAIAAYEVDMNELTPHEEGFTEVKTYHINLYDTKPWENGEEKSCSRMPEQRYGDVAYLNSFIADMREQGFLACYNHPYWSLQNYEDYKDLKGFWAMEIYNHGCEHDGLYGYNPQSYDEMLRTGQRLFCVSTDDNHNVYPEGDPLCDSFGGFTMIKAEGLSYEAVMKALENGDFYASMGPEILELTLEDHLLKIKTSPVEKIFVITHGRDCYKKLAKPGEMITEAEFELTGREGYIRVDCRDEKGLHACSNAYFLD